MERGELHPMISEIAQGSYKRKEPPKINGGGHAPQTLEAELWAFYKSESYREGCLKVVNLGGDADTTGAVFGQFAGALYGESGIPEDWLEKLAMAEEIRALADGLFDLAKRGSIPAEEGP